MFGRQRKDDEVQRLLSLAERLVPTASILALSLDNVVIAMSKKYGVVYPPMNPRFIFTYTMGGAAVAMLTASVDVMTRVGAPKFRAAVERGRQSVQHAPLMAEYSTLFETASFEAALKSYLEFRHAAQNAKQTPAENAGEWIWMNISDDLGRVPRRFRSELVSACGLAAVREFGPYWLTETEVEEIRSNKGPQ